MAKKKKVTKKKAAKKKAVKKTSKKDDSKLWAFLAVFLNIVGFVLAFLLKKDDQYVMHYAKQSLMVFIAAVIIQALLFVPLIGVLLQPLCSLVLLVLWIIGLVYSVSGDKKVIPIIGQFAEKLDF